MSLDDEVDEIIRSGRLGVVIHCGGRGERLGYPGPKPLVDLGDGERPLTNILKDIPAQVPVYLHLLKEHEDIFSRFLNASGNFGHRISYIIQQETALRDENGNKIAYQDGLAVKASNGPATFARQFVKAPDYFLSLDGAKLGVCFRDVRDGLKMLLADKASDAVVYARRLSKDEMQAEMARLDQGESAHTRFARVNEDAQKVYENPVMPRELVMDPDWLANSGMYLLRSNNYISSTMRLLGMTMRSRSIDALYKGYANHLKMAMTLKGYNGRNNGLRFRVYEQKLWDGYVKGVKTPDDIARLAELKKKGMFKYRCAA
ncbi:hypothetical protein KY337_04250 [Candidatus Woesearchaeota archaeon]|nr:hypothetical protein [Candidatus Woesearchaeota archaeon]